VWFHHATFLFRGRDVINIITQEHCNAGRRKMTPVPCGSTFALETLGCKVNQYESSYILETLKEAGYTAVPFRERADIYIVHSCAVTAKAGFQTRQLLRRAHRANPAALVVAAGCYAQLEGDRIAREQLATHILGNPGKFDLVASLSLPGTFATPCRSTERSELVGSVFEILPVSRMHTGRTRATLKIQDGCDSFCSYCVVPHVRGKSRSLSPETVLAQMERLVDAGYKEIVLTGIHLGQWGRDLDHSLGLSGLLRNMDLRHHPPRVRLSSLEPMEIDSELIDIMCRSPWICRHLHIPLQSGDSEILKRMRRPYTPTQYSDLVMRIHEVLPEAAIGADVLTGFPGETETQFRNSLDLLEGLPVSYLHVFPFSPRPGTPAATFTGQIQGPELRRRSQILQDLGRRKRRAFQEKFLGESLEILIETHREQMFWEGFSDNYISVLIRDTNSNLGPGIRIMVKIVGLRGENLEGEPVSDPL
jgi:threonylcarbamoyladenosine tRNA methylthiotransferase MtaB